MKDRQYHRDRYRRLKDGKVCVVCGMSEVGRYKLCLDCRKQRQTTETARRRRLRVPCKVCGRPRGAKNISGLCKSCVCTRANMLRWHGHTRLTNRERYAKVRSYQLERMKTLYDIARDSGMCVRCLVVPVKKFKQCQACRDKVRERYQRRKQRDTR